MPERVIPLELGVEWEPNAPSAVLLVRDDGMAQLALQVHPDDADQRPVRLVWSGCVAAVMQLPNDEAISGHRLYAKGLSTVVWAGEVLESQWIADLERQNRVHPRHDPAAFVAGLRHFILPLKECTVEVIASSWQILRADDSPDELALEGPGS
jgi:hypothetical protein